MWFHASTQLYGEQEVQNSEPKILYCLLEWTCQKSCVTEECWYKLERLRAKLERNHFWEGCAQADVMAGSSKPDVYQVFLFLPKMKFYNHLKMFITHHNQS